MPKRPLRPCKQPGCSQLTSDGYCDKHRSSYNKSRRDTEEAAFYRSERWRRLSIWYRKRHLICEVCNKELTDLVHHKVPIRDGGDKTALVNLQSICRKCHAIEHPIGG